MPQNTALKHQLYLQQRTSMYIFMVLFALIVIVYSSSIIYSIAFVLLFGFIVYLVDSGHMESEQRQYTPMLLGINLLLPVAFAPLLGALSHLWLFNTIILFQIVYLISKNNQQRVLIIIGIISCLLTCYLQGLPLYTIGGRTLMMTAISLFSVNAVNLLLKSQSELRNEISNKILLNHELQTTRVFQRQVLDSTNYAIIAISLNGTIIEFNKGAEQMLEYTADEILGKVTPMLFLDENEVIQRTQEINLKYNAGISPGIETLIYKNRIGLSNVSEWTYFTKNGRRVKVQLNINNLKDERGRITGFIGIAHDITARKQAEEQQHTAETIITNSPAILFRWLPDEKWSVIYVSANVYHIIGHTSLELTSGQVVYASMVHPQDYNDIMLETNKAIQQQQDVVNLEYRLKHKNGYYIWVEERTYIRYDDFGKVTFYEGIITEITQKKEAEDKLRASELRYELAVQGTAAGIWDWLDVNGTEEWWSPRFYELLGYENNEIPASLDTFRTIIHPDDLKATQEILKEHFINNSPFLIEYRFRTKSGRYKWFLGSGQVHRDKQGNPIRMVGSIIDIDHKKQSEELLRLNEERFRLLIESAEDIFYQTDPAGNFTYANEAAARLTGYSVAEISALNYTDLIPESYKEEAIAFYTEQLMQNKLRTYFELPLKTKSGDLVWIGQNVQLLHKDGTFIGFQSVARDITELKYAQKQVKTYTETLERTNRALDEFAFTVSHDLKAPLRGISHLAKWIEEEQQPFLTPESIGYFEHLNNRIQKMETFINRLLQYSRAGRQYSRTETISLAEFIRDITDILNVNKLAQVHIEAPDIPVSTDVISLDQVLSNLISNAFKHNNKRPVIHISCQQITPQQITISVEDNGPGITASQQQKMFNIFQPLHPNTEEINNSGIGLAIVKKIVEEKNGKLTVQSQPDKGSIFTFVWPAEQINS